MAETSTAQATSRVVEITNANDFRTRLQGTNSLVVVYFTAKWCGPCKAISPVVDGLSQQHPTVVFLKVDIEAVPEIAAQYAVKSIPQFHLLRRGQKVVDPLVGAQAERLVTLINQFKEVEDQAELPVGQMDLLPFVDQSQVECLNQSTHHTKNEVLKKNAHYLESDCDEQLLLYIPFNQSVKLHSIAFKAVDADRAPKSVKIFINKASMDFNSAESTPSVQEFELSEKDVLGDNPTLQALKYVKFQNVNSITFFFVNNQGGAETTAVNYIRLVGTPCQATNMNEFKRVSGQAGEVHD